MGVQRNRLSDSLQEASYFLRMVIPEGIPTAAQQLQKSAFSWIKQRASDSMGVPKLLQAPVSLARHFLQLCLIAHSGSAIRETRSEERRVGKEWTSSCTRHH